MKRKQFKEEQIIAVLREYETGAKAADLARKHGFAEVTLYIWQAKHDGMDVSNLRRLRELEAENARLKKLLAEQMLDASPKMIVLDHGIEFTSNALKCCSKPGTAGTDKPRDERLLSPSLRR